VGGGIVVYLEPANLALPYFAPRPEGLMSKTPFRIRLSGHRLWTATRFSRRYILCGQDEPTISQTFDDSVLSFYESFPGNCTDAGGHQLFLFRGGHEFQPQEIQSYIGLALKVANLLRPY